MFDFEDGFPCRQCDQILNNWDNLMFHMKLQHSKICYEYSKLSGTDSYVGDQTKREQNFQCSKCGLKFAVGSNLENQIVESHEVTCEILDMKNTITSVEN